jgi:hypothetical protein
VKNNVIFSLEVNCCIVCLANVTVFAKGSRCASHPCQNGGVCFDFPSADVIFVIVNLHIKVFIVISLYTDAPSVVVCQQKKFFPSSQPFTSDMALNYTCHCHNNTQGSRAVSYALDDCFSNETYVLKCDEEHLVGALPFTNKGFYICPFGSWMAIESCRLHHVWNDTRKECVPESN